MTTVNLLNLDRSALQSFFQSLNEPAFRADQMIQWIHQYGVTDFNEMTNLSKSLREKLIVHAEVKAPEIIFEKTSNDGTKKWLLRLNDGNAIETVFIPQADRGTLCVSSQVGCALNCSFCSTGKQGFSRNLTLAEIIGQVWIAARRLSKQKGKHDRSITNVVMMGMGEPLLNFDPVVQAMDLMLNDLAYGLSKYRVTLSTSGIVPEMKRLREVSPVSLAVSLHAPTDELRNELVPINKKYPLKQLIEICREYFPKESKREILFEYVMLKDINDTDMHAKMLIKLLQNVRAKINLIPFNTFPQTEYQTSTADRIARFQDILMKGGIQTTKRTTRGDDVDAACGQLVGQVFEKTQRKKQWNIQLLKQEEKAGAQ